MKIHFAVGALALVLSPVILPSTLALAAPETARKADDFVEGIGVVGTTTAYVSELGVRHTRGGVLGAGYRATDNPEKIANYNNYGTRSMFAAFPTAGQANSASLVVQSLKNEYPAGMIEIVEGPNEVDIELFSYPGASDSGNAARLWQNDFYNAIKADPATSSTQVASFTFANNYWYGQFGQMTAMDLNNYHQYFNWIAPFVTSGYGSPDDSIGAVNTWNNAGKPLIAGETGWATAPNDSPGHIPDNAGFRWPITEKAQGKYTGRLYAEYFNRNIRAYCFRLEQGGNQYAGETYGLVRLDGSKRPGYNVVKNLIATLGEATWNASSKKWMYPNFAPTTLDYTLSGPSTLRKTLLQKANGDFYLLVWNNVSSFQNVGGTERSGGNDINNADVAATLTCATPITSATQMRFDDNGNLSQSALTVTNNSVINLNVPDSVLIIKLTSGTNVHGGFESPNVGNANYAYRPAGSGWNFANNAGIQSNGSAWWANNAPEGTQTAFLQSAGALGAIGHNVTLTPGTYSVSFKLARRVGQTQPVKVSIGGVDLGTYTPFGNAFQSFTTPNFTRSSTGTVELKLEATNNAGDNSTFVDQVVVNVVPSVPDLQGGFETPNVGAANYQYQPAGSPWSFANNAGIQSNGSAWNATNAPEGTQTAFLQSNGPLGALARTVTLPAGTYSISFKLARRGGQIQPIKVTLSGSDLGTYTPSGNAFQTFTTPAFTRSSTGSVQIKFEATTGGGDASSFLDGVTLN